MAEIEDITNQRQLLSTKISAQIQLQDQAEILKMPREAWILTCKKWLAETPERVIALRCNPSDVQWNMPQRSVMESTHYGKVLHIWMDPVRGTYFDNPTLSFTFQSGNILPIPPSTQRQPSVPSGLQNFYDFMDLVDEQKIIDDVNSPSFGSTNHVYIFYNSRVFPQITLAGLFNPEGLQWSESADNPNMINWQASFTVFNTFPQLKASELTRSFMDAGFSRA